MLFSLIDLFCTKCLKIELLWLFRVTRMIQDHRIAEFCIRCRGRLCGDRNSEMAILHNLCWTPMRLVSFEENQSLKIPYHELYKVEAELSMWYYIYYISKRVSMMRDGFRFFWLLLLPKVKVVVELQFFENECDISNKWD